jgi:hypothetical protein
MAVYCPPLERSLPMKIPNRTTSIVVAIVIGIVGALVQAQNQPQGQTPRPANQTPNPQNQATEDFAAPASFPLAAPAGVDSRSLSDGAASAVNTGPFDPAAGSTVLPSIRPWREDLEPGEAQDAAGWQGHRRYACSARPIRRRTARWPSRATTSSGPRCSTISVTGIRPR